MIVTSSDTLTHTVEIVCGGVQDSAIRDVLEETELTFQDAGGLYLWNSTDTVVPLTPGVLYFVEFNNARYECVAETRLFGEILGVGIGNASIVGLGDDTGEPFLFGTMIDNSMSACYCSLGAVTCQISISAMKLAGLPAVSTNDSGKILKVVDGVWSIAEESGTAGESTTSGVALPEVTADDNGKVLRVVNGAWAKSESELISETLAETDLSFTAAGEGLYVWQSTDNIVPLEIGKLYFVGFNGVEYECVGTAATLGSLAGVGIGNPAFAGLNDTGEPFLFGTALDGSFSACYCSTGTGPYALSIRETKQAGLPGVTSADEEKILQIVDGKWSVVDLANSSIATYIQSCVDDALAAVDYYDGTVTVTTAST